jgi:hypothetical protein
MLAPIMQFYFYRIDRDNIYRHKMVKDTFLAAPQRKIGTPQKLDFRIPQRMALTQRYLT